MATTTLSAGDIAIIGFNYDNPDEFAFTPLVDIGAGTEINFTDNGWQAAGTFRATEGTFTWTAPTDITAGTIINPTVSSILFSASGDQIIAYQGTDTNPTFIYALNSEGNPGIWQSDSTSSNTSALPTGLVNGETAVALNEIDNAIYTGITSGTQAELLAAIGDNSNWSGSNSTRQTMPTNPFTVSGSGGTTPLISEFQPNPTSTDPAQTTFELSGTPGDAFDGVIVSIESDSGSSAGRVDRVASVSGTFDANGLLTLDIPDLENPSFTVALLSEFTGSTSTDIDTDNDGVADDLSTFGTVFDAIGVPDNTGDQTFLYGTDLGGTDFAYTGDEPRLIFRDASVGDLYAINDPDNGQVFDVNGTDVTPAIFDTDPTIGTGTFGTINPSTGTTDNGGDPDPTPTTTFIHEIQGSSDSSSLEGQTVTIEAVVVGDYQDGASGTNGDLNGFFLQEEDADADADPLTSEGLFIFDGSSPAVDVNIGDVVEVTGTVDEFFGLTQLTNVSVSIQGTDTLPTPATVNFPVTTVDDLEAFEGMGITIPDTLFVTGSFNLDRFGEVILSSDGTSNEPGTDGRLEQFTDFNAPDVAGFAAYQEAIATRRILLDDGQTVQNPDTIIHGRGGNPLSSTNTLRGGDTVDNLSGVLSFGFGEYRIQPVNPVDFQATNPRPVTPDPVGGDLTVAGLNVLNFFTTLDETGNPGSGPNGLSPRGADNQAEFDRQVEKLVTTLAEMDADVVGLVELENEFGSDQNGDGQFAIDTLVDELNNRVGAGTYAYVDPGVPFVETGDAISVGAIYKTDSVQVAPGTTVEILTDSDLPGLGLSGTVFDGASTNRAPMAVTFEELATGERFTISVNHFKSKGGTGSGDDADIGDGQGNFNGTRLRGSQALNAWLNTDPTGSGDSDFLIVGDLNAYAQEDPITFLEAQGYTDLAQQFVGNDAYSFTFDGQLGTLDYALANSSLINQVTGATEWHVNADEPDALDYNLDFGRDPNLFNGQDPFRNSDHDPIIVGLNLQSSTSQATFGATPGAVIDGTSGGETLIGTDGDDTITGFRRGDILTGGGGSDTFVYTSLRDGRDTITDFEVTSDKIDLSQVLSVVGFEGIDPIADGYVDFASTSNGTYLRIDPDGSAGIGRPRTLLLVSDVDPTELNNSDNFIF
ncbi:MAG: ExeM/NucH family extracellular endonuclease [Okeania sp. SIO3I5]|uniref:ExeM/NucH family extracellular endonuclease n=1 Tax=Okeania sp. SIO3I5 TaxID=2607805 RepID=UPI0013B75827|nr:ExeM/NucH family extracellular endonuclease [Okeania sp. SIO3I5]NEQ40084.1 ExeM/NucH family extracellular endonuclease [Okeania sp. SIO3I5]